MHTDRQMPLDSRPNGGRRPPDRPVVCAVDDDGLAADVIATGAALAERLNVSLTVVHSPYPDVFLTGEARRLALERGHALVDEVTDGYVVDERIVEVDDPARLISAVAAEANADAADTLEGSWDEAATDLDGSLVFLEGDRLLRIEYGTSTIDVAAAIQLARRILPRLASASPR